MGSGRAFAVLCVAGIAFVGAGCGGDESSASPTLEWADGFCTAITSWTNALEEVTAEFSDPSSLSQEGLEAAASGKAIVTTALGVDGLDLGSGDEVVIADSPREFADAVVALSADVTRRRRLERRARRVALTYDWSGIGHRFCALVEEVGAEAVARA